MNLSNLYKLRDTGAVDWSHVKPSKLRKRAAYKKELLSYV